jgi:hypothetical protein
MGKYKVVVDTSVLIAASLNHVCNEVGGIKLKDHFYSISEPLFKYFSENIDKQQGLVTHEIEDSVKAQIINVMIKKISQQAGISQADLKKNISAYSRTLILINDSLRKNLNLLMRIPTNEKEISKNYMKACSFFESIMNKLPNNHPKTIVKKRVKSVPKWMRKYEKEYARQDESTNMDAFKKLRKKLNQNPPDRNDFRILANAIYLNDKNIYPGHKICIASTDQHFSRIRGIDASLSTYIPEKIEERLHVCCDWPDEILKLLKK